MSYLFWREPEVRSTKAAGRAKRSTSLSLFSLSEMAGPPCHPFIFPELCAVSDDFLPWVTPVSRIAKKIRDLGTEDSATMMKQLYYLRGLVVQETKLSGNFRIMIGSAHDNGVVYIWFPVLLKHADGILTIDFFNRLIQIYTLYLAGKSDECVEMSRDLIG